MARIIPALEEDWVTYVPEFENNRGDPNPVTCEIHPISTEELRAYQRGAISGKQDPRANARRADAVAKRIFSERVRNVRNYVYGKPILTGADLYGAEQFIQDDVFQALTDLSTLTEGLLGKLPSRSGSISPRTAGHGGGDAVVAGEARPPPRTSLSPSEGESATATTSQSLAFTSPGHRS